jgi:hypothetical protein
MPKKENPEIKLEGMVKATENSKPDEEEQMDESKSNKSASENSIHSPVKKDILAPVKVSIANKFF